MSAPAPSNYIDVFLNPGDFYFGDRETRIRTILGSCVAITMWHPKLLIGGMCHYVLPNRIRRVNEPLDGRYADEAVEMFLREIRAAGTQPNEYQIKVFGGGKMFVPEHQQKGKDCLFFPCNNHSEQSCRSVSCRNVLTAKLLIDQLQLSVKNSCTGGSGHRKLFFDVWSGHVWSRLTPKEHLAERNI